MKKLILVDGFSLLFRAYYATAYSGNLMRNSKGLHTNMLFGFANMLNKLMKEEFSHILIAFDAGKKTFRHEMFPEYKAGRSETPPELIEQIPYAKQLVDLLGIKQYQKDGFEADDIIGTMARVAEGQDFQVEVYTGDKDLLQLSSSNTTVNITKRGITELEKYTPKYLFDKMEITPDQVTDLKGLMGDKSDNLPGIPGVGEKTAVKLLKQYFSLEGIYEHADEIKGKLGEKVRDNEDIARLCKKMATILREGDFDLSLLELEYNGFDQEKLNEFYRELEFRAFIKQTAKKTEFKVLDSESIYDIDKYLKQDSIVQVEVFEENYHRGTVLGISIINDEAIFVPFEVIENSMSSLPEWLADEKVRKFTYDYKQAKVALRWNGYDFNGVTFDLLLASYVVNANTRDNLYHICMTYNYDDCLDPEVIYGRGAKKAVPDLPTLSNFSIKNAYAIQSLKDDLLSKVKENNQEELLQLELDLASTLADMEFEGVIIDTDKLHELKSEFMGELDVLQKRIHELAGKNFNINSPKQLGVILFEELELPHGKKTKTGYSTSVDVLEKLKDYEIVEKILEYRTLSKLVSTYIEGIEKVMIEEDGIYKVHTIFRQAQTATGRLSSIEPNLQNLPIKTEKGRLIRQLFIPYNGNQLLSADYSQIELRVIASLSNTDVLIEAFKSESDIHTETAMKVFNVSKDEVTPRMRRQAKAVNFGIIYGQGAWGLSEEIHVTTKEAQQFIDDYYASFPGIKKYLEAVVESGREHGYVETIMNRRRYIPDLYSSNRNVRSFGERTAKNAPIQGSAADIIKKAMVLIDNEMKKKKLKSKLLIQIHDELTFDVVESEVEIMKELVPRVMEDAVKLDVPLKVEYGLGKNLFEVK